LIAPLKKSEYYQSKSLAAANSVLLTSGPTTSIDFASSVANPETYYGLLTVSQNTYYY
jgi:hypothetical protein